MSNISCIEGFENKSATGSRRWKPYPAYRDSGVEWLGEVPEHWEIMRLRFICKVNPPKSEVSKYPSDTIVSFLPMELISENGILSLMENRTVEQVWQGYTYFKDNDVILAKITPCFENGKGAICSGLINGIGFGTTELHVLRSSELNHSRFIFYLTISDPFRKIGTAMMYGAAGQQRVPEEFIKDFKTGLPPISEQITLASFLDRRTAHLDTLISKKEHLIALLKEKRAALISRAVTKGLDPNVSMKDSGVEWLGEVPEHWEVKRIRFICKINPSKSEISSLSSDTLVSFLPMEMIDENGTLSLEETRTIEHVWQGFTYFKDNDVILAKITPCFENGKGAICSNLVNNIGFGTTELHVIRSLEFSNSRFIYYLTKSDLFRKIGIAMMYGAAGQQRIPEAFIKNFKVGLSPLPEQRAIASFLDRETARIDALISKVREVIKKLREYRTALISAAVTGKIDVREVV